MFIDNNCMYIARDKSGLLFCYKDKPIKLDKIGIFSQGNNNNPMIGINNDDFKDITWENSPQMVKFVISND